MQILKEFITILDVMLILLIWMVGRKARDKVTAVGFSGIAALVAINACLLWI